jgi:branched-chain amino acid transport system ATP-binding protein
MIEKINKQGVTVLLIEQNANMALQVSQRAYVLENGLVSMSGKASDIANNPMVKKAYLGMA